MMIIELILGLLCATGILAFMIQLGVVVNRFILSQNPSPQPLEELIAEPDGVISWIPMSDGTRLRGFHKGSGPAVVLLHDFGLPVQMMTQIWRHLAPMGFRIIAFDMRGHGASEGKSSGLSLEQYGEDLKEVLDFYRVEDGILVGQAGGAVLGLSYLMKEAYSARIKGMVALSGFAVNKIGGFSAQGLKHRLLGKAWFQRLIHHSWYGSGFANTAFGPEANMVQVRAYLELLQAQPARRFRPLFEEMSQLDLLAELPRISLPIQLVAGRQDHRVHPIHSLQLSRRLPDAEAFLLDGKGHMLCWESPKWIAEQIRTFQRSLEMPLEEAS